MFIRHSGRRQIQIQNKRKKYNTTKKPTVPDRQDEREQILIYAYIKFKTDSKRLYPNNLQKNSHSSIHQGP